MLPSEWQPIETAPKDGTQILCFDVRTGEIRVAIRKLFFDRSGAYEWFRDDKIVPGHTWSLLPTHWMPLPAPPVAHLAKEQEHSDAL
jgi:hypothetical protein